jgi:hypothetical protein
MSNEVAVRWVPVGAVCAALFAVGASGCVRRTLLTFEDQPKHPFVAAEVLERKSFLFFGSTERKYVMCQDTGDQMVCARSCGGEKDIACPKSEVSSLGKSSNVR